MPIQVSTSKPLYIDLDPNFTRSPKSGDVLTVKDERAINLSVRNLLSTAYGERLFQPNVGGSLRPLLFEPVDAVTAMEIRDRVLKTLTEHEPRITNVYVDVVSMPDDNAYTVSVEYSIKTLEKTDKISVILERIR